MCFNVYLFIQAFSPKSWTTFRPHTGLWVVFSLYLFRRDFFSVCLHWGVYALCFWVFPSRPSMSIPGLGSTGFLKQPPNQARSFSASFFFNLFLICSFPQIPPLVVYSCPRIWKILSRQLLTKVLTFCGAALVIIHVPESQRSTLLTLILDILRLADLPLA